jgi:hypothetical protein
MLITSTDELNEIVLLERGILFLIQFDGEMVVLFNLHCRVASWQLIVSLEIDVSSTLSGLSRSSSVLSFSPSEKVWLDLLGQPITVALLCFASKISSSLLSKTFAASFKGTVDTCE